MKTLFIQPLLVLLSFAGQAQTFTSSADGAFSTGSNWSGGSAPPLSGQTYGSVTVQNNMSTSGSYTVGSFALSVSSGKTFTVNGSLTLSNSGGSIDVYGVLIVTGALTTSASTGSFVIHPGGMVDVYGNTTIDHNNGILVGTNASAPPYADLILEGNVTFASGGAGLTVNKNGRVVVYGNFTSSSGGGQVLQVNDGGQMYVNGNVALTGGGDQINTNNTAPYGLYVNGTTSNTGGGASTSSYVGTKSSMQSTDPNFYTWVQTQHNSPLPVTLTYFSATKSTSTSVSLRWTTSSEVNFNYFEVEKSIDAKTFNKMAQVQGHGTTSQIHTYQVADESPIIGKNYYRLKSVDFDGHTEIFEIVEAEFHADKKISVYPNPLVDQKLHVDLNFEPRDKTNIVISDLTGAVKISVTTNELQNTLSVTLDSGVYIVSVANDSLTRTDLIVVK